jgi:hypothetical protein
MSGLRTLTGLPPARRALVLRSLVLVSGIRVLLFILPLQRLQRLLSGAKHIPFSVPADTPVTHLVWAVRAASRRVPAATCLTQSLALQFLMACSGRAAQVQIGVAKDGGAGFQSHAWVKYAGETLLSDPSETERYALLLTMENG